MSIHSIDNFTQRAFTRDIHPHKDQNIPDPTLLPREMKLNSSLKIRLVRSLTYR